MMNLTKQDQAKYDEIKNAFITNAVMTNDDFRFLFGLVEKLNPPAKATKRGALNAALESFKEPQTSQT